jgi:hypothetical protein
MIAFSFLEAMIATHLAYLVIASAAALLLRGIRKSLERMAEESEGRVPTTASDVR